MRPRRAVLAIVTLLGAGLGAGGAAAQTSPASDPGVEYLEGARARAAQHEFSGEVLVEWQEPGAVRQRRVLVRQAGGVLQVGAEPRVVLDERGAYVAFGGTWQAIPSAASWSTPPPPADKYRVVVGSQALVAGRPAHVVEAYSRAGGRRVERYVVDDETGVVLQRVVYDTAGGVVQRITFVWLETTAVDPRSVPTAPPGTVAAPAETVGDLDRPYLDPDSAGDGFDLVGRLVHRDGTAQLVYSDGLVGVSVFEQPGRLAWETLPPGGTRVLVDGVPALRYSLPVGNAIVWERDGLVITCVGSVAAEELESLAADLASPRREDRLARLARLVLAPFRW